MSTTACGGCASRLMDGAHLCHSCTGKLRALLWNVPAMAHQLWLAETRQTAIRRPDAPSASGRALVWDEAAAQAREELEGILCSWAAYVRAEATLRVLEETTDPTNGQTVLRPRKANPEPPATHKAPDVAVWLTRWLDWLRRQDTAPVCMEELTEAYAAAAKVIDTPARLVFLGTCRHEWEDEDGHPRLCTARVYTENPRQPTECPRCGHLHDSASLRRQALARAEDLHLPAAQLTRLLATPQLDVSVTVNDIKNWATRGKLTPAGLNRHKRPVYRVGDVLDVAAAMQAKHQRGTAA